MEGVRALIPEEHYEIVEPRQHEFPGGVLNKALSDFEPMEVPRWHLSIMIQLQDLLEHGMPSQDDRDLLDPSGDSLDAELKVDKEHPTVLFLGRIALNRARELL